MRYHLEKLFGCSFLNKGLIRHLTIWKTLRFKALTHIWLSKVYGPALLKERWRRFLIFFNPKSCWAQQSTIQTFILLSNSAIHGFFRHLIIWKRLDLQALTQILLSKVNGPALLKERWGRFCFFFQPQKLLATIGYHPNIHIIE